nr:phospholipase A1-like [Onthophagus taurus]
MKLFLVLAVLAFATALPVNRRFWFIPDDEGKVHLVDTQSTPKIIDPVDGRNFTFYLYTPLNKDEPFIFNGEELDLLFEAGVFDPNLPSLFTTHGWGGSGESTSVTGVKDSILASNDLNVFCLDWSGPAGEFYTLARSYVNPVGDLIGEAINEIIDHYQVDASTVNLMGHSLGGQLVGRIGRTASGRLGSIVALDPAWPGFSLDNLDDRLDTTDAQFVQVIHVNSGFLGYPYSVGHADFYLNGGVKQPGCGPDIIGTCSHFLIKDMILYTYSSAFMAVKCNSYEDYVDGGCSDNSQSYWGGWPVDTSAIGDYYMDTEGEPPFVIES